MAPFYGIIVGLVTFVIIGVFHPIVIKTEYHLGTRVWPVFLVLGVVCLGASVLVASPLASPILGVLGFTFFWSIRELFEQARRVEQGRFPRNPKRKVRAKGAA
ncbi:MAG TPA: DUF4491 family protein [Spirochaetia bacterium]